MATARLSGLPRRRAARLDRQLVLAEPDPTVRAAAIHAWSSRQAALLDDLYTESYVEGRRNFHAQFPEHAPDADELDPDSVVPDPEAMTTHRASVAKLAGELHRLVASGADEDLVDCWFDDNERRLDQTADTLTWTAEQQGYYEAGTATGMEIEWELEEGAHHCRDCPEIASRSPYTTRGGDNPLPFLPGTGHTECGPHCRCSLNYRAQGEPAAAAFPEEAAAAAQDAADEMGFGSVEAVPGEGLEATVQRIGGALRRLPRQVGVALDADGNVLAAHIGTPDVLVYSAGQLGLMRGAAVHVHNHPDGESFSPADVAFALGMGFQESRLFTPDAEYVLRPGDEPPGPPDALDVAEGIATDMAQAAYADAATGYRDQLTGHLRFGTFLNWPDFWSASTRRFWHRVWQRAAVSLGLYYVAQDDSADTEDGTDAESDNDES
jgi:hypothetical protein